MVRTRNFNPEVILDAALALFWRKGYKNCCMADVVRRSGVARYGLYQVFKDKDKLYHASLKHYHRKIRERFMDPFCVVRTGKQPDLSTLVSVFNIMIDDMEKDRYSSCFAHQAAIERAKEDPEVNAIVSDFFEEVKDRYRITIKNAVELGQIRNQPIEDLVIYVMGIERAIIAMAKQNCSIDECKDYVRCALALLKPESTKETASQRRDDV